MRTKKLLLGALASIVGVLTFLPMVIATWGVSTGTTTTQSWKLFEGDGGALSTTFGAFNKTYQPIWRILVAVFVTIALVSAVLFTVMYMIELFSADNSHMLNTIERALSIITLVCGIMIAIFAIIYTAVNRAKNGDLSISVMGKAGLYIAIIMPMLSGIIGLIATCNKDREKSY